LGNLTKLENLYLDNNGLSGSIPPELGNLSKLKYLILYNNALTGTIPSTLGNLKSLQYLFLYGNKLTGTIPDNLTTLGNLSNLIIRYNALYTSNSGLITFLNNKDSLWANAQTLAPVGVTTGDVTEGAVTVQWSPVTYTADPGGYIVSYSTSRGGPYTYFGMAEGKSSTQLGVTGLDINTTYYFTVQTYTSPHTYNQNTVISDYSQETLYYPALKDTDSDGIFDGEEDINRNGIVDTGETDPSKADTDDDGISDGVEDANHNRIVDVGETDPLNNDTDNDGMPDGWEVQHGLNPLVQDADKDADNDGYSNLKEFQRRTDPLDSNSHPSKGMPWLPLLLED